MAIIRTKRQALKIIDHMIHFPANPYRDGTISAGEFEEDRLKDLNSLKVYIEKRAGV